MKKISTLFKKDPNDLGRVINEINPDNDWVLKQGVPYIKRDGSACMIIDGELYKRYDVKRNRIAPKGAIPCQEADEVTGHHPHWVKCERNDTNDKYHFEAFDILEQKFDGTYELCGEKVNGNKEDIKGHVLIKHDSEPLAMITDFSFESIKSFLSDSNMEGIVFHDIFSDRKCKIRRKDFGLKW